MNEVVLHMRKILGAAIAFFVCLPTVLQSQTLSLENTLDLVRQYHPVCKQANLAIDFANASLRATRGAFDPSIYTKAENKTFDQRNYYSYTNAELKIPTWYGIDIKAGTEDNLGEKFNTELTPGKNNYLGISLPVLKGLLLDKRRASLQQAKLFVKMSRQDQLIAYNNILFEAAEAYWLWIASSKVLAVLDESVKVNQKRFELVKESFLLGDRAAIDTIEALAQFQQIQTARIQALLDFQSRRLVLSNYLWTADQQPYVLSDKITPDTSWDIVSIVDYPLPNLNELLVSSAVHPKLMSMDIKMDALEIDRKLKFQQMLPSLDLQYNFLSSGYWNRNIFNQQLFQNNYKFGVNFAIPLFLRESRGEYAQAKIKINDLDYSIRQQRLEIENKVKQYFNEILAVRNQVLLQQSNIINHQLLLKAEETKFSIGESSMFLVNARENKLLEANQKMAELKAKFFKSLLAVQWAAGGIR
ncbi:MAG: TolC family protein [bacterium]|jgi:outer membrane protein TolC